MYKIMKSTNNGIDELELDGLEKGCWIDIVSPSPEELHEIADATGIQMDFLSAALDDEEKSRIERALFYRRIILLPFVWNPTPSLLIFRPTIINCSALLKRRAFCSRYFINPQRYT